jgi:hypothetical protein
VGYNGPSPGGGRDDQGQAGDQGEALSEPKASPRSAGPAVTQTDDPRRSAGRSRVARRSLTAAVVTGVLVLVGLLLAADLLLRDGGRAEASCDVPLEGPERTPTRALPRGGTRLFPDYRVVAFYGAPGFRFPGTLGVGSPEQAARRLLKQARPYGRQGRRIMPAFELVATFARRDPTEGGLYRECQPERVIRRYLQAARRVRAMLVVNIQPGRSTFIEEVRRLRPYLEQPDVGVALDPEWNVGPQGIPGRTIGSVDAATVNQVSAYLSGISQRHELPQKILIVHRFTKQMIRNERRLKQRRRVRVTVNFDGFGPRAVKVRRYERFARRRDRIHNGITLFYERDTSLLTPARVTRLRPRPDLIAYE